VSRRHYRRWSANCASSSSIHPVHTTISSAQRRVHRRRLFGDDLHDHLQRRAANVRRLAGEHFVQHRRQRVHVAARRL
jgi:hypothetical protein